jgi:hypothetical protein
LRNTAKQGLNFRRKNARHSTGSRASFELRQANVFSTAQAIMKSSGMRLDDSERSALAAYALDGIASGDDSQSQLLAATQQMQETQMSFNLQYLQLQSQMQNENRSYTAVSNIMKTRHDTVKNSINNVR